MKNLIVASSYQERLATWGRGLNGFAGTTLITDILITDGLDILRKEVARIKPQILMLDFDLLGSEGLNVVVNLRRLCAESKIIIMASDISEDLEWELLKAGMRGCCRGNIEPKHLAQVVAAVQNGELWIRRTLTGRLIDELSHTPSKIKTYRATLALLSKLTQREYDIALRVGDGEHNKQIAQACKITERTVKSHLTEIYLKLGVTDRLNLALVLAADERVACANLGRKFKGGSRVSDIQSFGKKSNLSDYLDA